jgi:hypothetical protein
VDDSITPKEEKRNKKRKKKTQIGRTQKKME